MKMLNVETQLYRCLNINFLAHRPITLRRFYVCKIDILGSYVLFNEHVGLYQVKFMVSSRHVLGSQTLRASYLGPPCALTPKGFRLAG